MNAFAEVDGSARPNPGPGGWGVVLRYQGKTLELKGFLPWATNNLAEYRALSEAVKAAKALGAESLEVHTDSELVANQFAGRWEVADPKLREALEGAKKEAKGLSVNVVHVPRERVRRAHELAREALTEGRRGR